jgi:serine/threonine-protein kinase HipA
MSEQLHLLSGGDAVGRVIREPHRNKLTFRYEPDWASNPESFPLSLSMPLTATEHQHDVIEPFLWGLLPDNDGVLRRWGSRFQVSPKNAFALLSHVGEDCAGAIQFIRPEKLESWTKGPPKGKVDWLGRAELNERIALLLRDHAATRSGSDLGQFSLAGAQPKIALFQDPVKKHWGIPSGSMPTTHILKPATGAFDGFAENEHFCLRLARECGLATASSTVEYFGKSPVIVVERYDRMRRGRQVLRIHQEDFCQALGRPPQHKYQNEGGPSAADILSLIRQYSSNRAEDEAQFVDALIFAWLVGATDAHAKNFSLLIAPGGQVRLAPLYDLSSALPYPRQVDLGRASLAMKIGGSYRLGEIGRRQWEKFALENRLRPNVLEARLVRLLEELPSKSRITADFLREEGIAHPIVGELVKSIAAHSAQCRKGLAKTGS